MRNNSLEEWKPQDDHMRVHLTLKPDANIGDIIAGLSAARVTVQTCTPAGGDLEAVLDAKREMEGESA